MGQDTGSSDTKSNDQNLTHPPTQEDLDAYFGAARIARVFSGPMDDDELTDTRLVRTLAGEQLRTLRQALRVSVGQEPRCCPCRGDLTIELVGDAGGVAILSLHYHLSPLLRHKGWSYDAELGSRHDLFTYLTQCGISSALQNLEKHLREDEQDYQRQLERSWLNGQGRIPVGEIFMEASKKRPE